MPYTLIKSSNPEDFVLVHRFLMQAIQRLRAAGIPLWEPEDVSVDALVKAYGTHSLYLVMDNEKTIGGVFVLEEDALFWPEIVTNDSFFFHKLVIGDDFITKGIGHRVLDALVELAKSHGKHWLRCDCHGDRPRLRNFYESFGFYFIDRKTVEGFDAARYEYPCL
ncbi:GNAT family N-acetyltransferase [Enterovibrio sp. ZSDZ35]|uniref:GNAT family N-acetyltransferase n=1 Tax=Enterovibrio qingdaonensis TaxID=2899818 RepID=A0ABT5QRP1_9GAMM|nr:GNAT family N-acetyltransferase [Enterovibrio sp. ZSDZ35]MDD1783652.1 GNAT family N-acetyltransferase [Enterovibrio sp. ZSDZ35]